MQCFASLVISTNFSLSACILENPGSQKLLGVTIDRKFNINESKQKNVSTCSNFLIGTPNTETNFNECLFNVSFWLLSFSLDEPQ